MERTKNKSKINEAIQLTIRTINSRGTYFRNFVIGIIVLVLISLVWSGIKISWIPLLGLLLLVPICGIFLYLDTSLVNKWRQQILEIWMQENLDLHIFSSTISNIRTLPSHTLHAMLSTLPNTKNNLYAQFSPDIRKALTMTLKTINCCHNDRIVFTTVAYSMCSSFLSWAVIRWTWHPLLGFLFVLPLIGVNKWINFQRLRHWEKYIMDIIQQNKLILKDFIEAATQLDWGSIIEKKESLLNALNNINSVPWH